jgi:hypothetical protein
MLTYTLESRGIADDPVANKIVTKAEGIAMAQRLLEAKGFKVTVLEANSARLRTADCENPKQVFILTGTKWFKAPYDPDSAGFCSPVTGYPAAFLAINAKKTRAGHVVHEAAHIINGDVKIMGKPGVPNNPHRASWAKTYSGLAKAEGMTVLSNMMKAMSKSAAPPDLLDTMHDLEYIATVAPDGTFDIRKITKADVIKATLDRFNLVKGEMAGHAFRGNQYTGGKPGVATHGIEESNFIPKEKAAEMAFGKVLSPSERSEYAQAISDLVRPGTGVPVWVKIGEGVREDTVEGVMNAIKEVTARYPTALYSLDKIDINADRGDTSAICSKNGAVGLVVNQAELFSMVQDRLRAMRNDAVHPLDHAWPVEGEHTMFQVFRDPMHQITNAELDMGHQVPVDKGFNRHYVETVMQTKIMRDTVQLAIIHEAGHMIDYRHSIHAINQELRQVGHITSGFTLNLDAHSLGNQIRYSPSGYGRSEPAEKFAEAFASTFYPEHFGRNIKAQAKVVDALVKETLATAPDHEGYLQKSDDEVVRTPKSLPKLIDIIFGDELAQINTAAKEAS